MDKIIFNVLFCKLIQKTQSSHLQTKTVWSSTCTYIALLTLNKTDLNETGISFFLHYIQSRIRGPQECFPSLLCLRLLHTEHISYPTNPLYRLWWYSSVFQETLEPVWNTSAENRDTSACYRRIMCFKNPFLSVEVDLF